MLMHSELLFRTMLERRLDVSRELERAQGRPPRPLGAGGAPERATGRSGGPL